MSFLQTPSFAKMFSREKIIMFLNLKHSLFTRALPAILLMFEKSFTLVY